MCRVDDILHNGPNAELLVTEKVFRTFRAGDTGKLSPKTPIVSTSTLRQRHDAYSWEIQISQSHYAGDMQKVAVAQFAQNGEIMGPEKLRTFLRRRSVR